eukprot:TRINITY_DN124_c0_g1_i1.p2 TRINITY_DN124_c0_g1~~TRINITY_DN124_c0_g1_i1.p2  ORF type:complete len:135 (-),score=22.57 TRINITY_DN124_c0_g1_i1:339-743(-)
MACVTAASLSVSAAPALKQFDGLRVSSAKSQPALMVAKTSRGSGSLGARCDYIGSSTNLIVVGTTTLFLVAARFGLAPSANRKSSAGLKLSERPTGLETGDPAGFTATDVLAMGAAGHGVAVGIVLGLKAIGAI